MIYLPTWNGGAINNVNDTDSLPRHSVNKCSGYSCNRKFLLHILFSAGGSSRSEFCPDHQRSLVLQIYQYPAHILLPAGRLKMALQRAYQTIGGSCQWPASAVVENAGKYRDALVAEYHKYPALPPVFDFMDNEAPDKVRKVKPVWTADGYILFWTAPKFKDEMNRPVQYVVYRFGSKEKVDIDDPSHIVAVTRNTFYKLPYEDGKTKYRYVVTALDRLHNESKSVSKKVKL